MPKRVVHDTNILVSSLWGGNPMVVINRWKTGKITICVSKEIIHEYLEVISRFSIAMPQALNLLMILGGKSNIEFVKPSRDFSAIREDPDDNMFLDAAVESQAEYLITGDSHLLKLKTFKGIKIISPEHFLSEVQSEKD
jgi:putative PIN family toxin of toxin-antitoxin system